MGDGSGGWVGGSVDANCNMHGLRSSTGGVIRGATHLGQLLLAAATAHAHAVDDEALLGLVTQVARLLRPRRARCAVDHRQLTVLPAAHTQQEADSVRLLLAPDLLQVLEGALRTNGGVDERCRLASRWVEKPLSVRPAVTPGGRDHTSIRCAATRGYSLISQDARCVVRGFRAWGCGNSHEWEAGGEAEGRTM